VVPSLKEKSEKSPFPALILTTPYSSTLAFFPSAPILEMSGSDSAFKFFDIDF